MTIRGLAIGLTIWFSALGVLLFLAVQMRMVPDVPLVQILFLYSYYLLPVRWGLVLTMLIRGARAMPPRGLPHPMRIALFVVVQLLLGFFSFVGLYAMADERGGKARRSHLRLHHARRRPVGHRCVRDAPRYGRGSGASRRPTLRTHGVESLALSAAVPSLKRSGICAFDVSHGGR